jgi:hypothetical protein
LIRAVIIGGLILLLAAMLARAELLTIAGIDVFSHSTSPAYKGG